MPLAVNSKSNDAIKFEKNAIRKTVMSGLSNCAIQLQS